MSIDEMIAVLQAEKEGRKIQMRYCSAGMKWADCRAGHIWNFHNYEYRSTPEPPKPRVIWVHEANIDFLSTFASPDQVCFLEALNEK